MRAVDLIGYLPGEPSDGSKTSQPATFWATRDFTQDRRLARLGPGARREALFWAAHLLLRVWLTFGLQPVGRRDEAWLKKGLPCS